MVALVFGALFLNFWLACGTAVDKLVDADHDVMFLQFLETYEKSYESEEEHLRRRNAFVENLKVCDERNKMELAAGGTAVHGVTKFSDLSQEEFRAKLLSGLIIPPDLESSTDENVEERKLVSTGVTAKDWTGIN
jgi:hypothetical protein